jgi:ORF6N domain
MVHMPKPKVSKEERAVLQLVRQRIYYFRGQNVLLSTHLAELYEVESRVFMQAVRRSRTIFPDRDVFQLSADEFSILISQSVISKHNYIRHSRPYAFSARGIVLLAASGILHKNHRHIIAMNMALLRTLIRPHRFYLCPRPVLGLW